MGITWIIGVLVIEVEELFPLAFIFTVIVAFQGLFIFVILIVLDSRQKLYKEWKANMAKSSLISRFFNSEKSLTLSSTLNPVSINVQSLHPLSIHNVLNVNRITQVLFTQTNKREKKTANNLRARTQHLLLYPMPLVYLSHPLNMTKREENSILIQ